MKATNASAVATLSWTNYFADERLKQLIDLALTNNCDFQVAVLNVEQSRAQYRITGSRSLPTVNASGSYQKSHANGATASQWGASLGSTAYEVDLFGRVRSLNRQALEQYFATVEGKRSAQFHWSPRWPQNISRYARPRNRLRWRNKPCRRCRILMRSTKATLRRGTSSELDLRTAEGQVQTAKINLLAYERDREQAENYLVLLIGQPMPTNLPPARSFNDTNLLADIPAGCRRNCCNSVRTS